LTRPNLIVVGLVIVTAPIVCLEVYALVGSRRHTAPAAPAEATASEPPPPPAVVDRAPPGTPPPPPAPPAPAPPAPAPVATAPAPSLALVDASAAPAPSQDKRPLFVAPDPERVLRDADEQAFETLHLPEATRAAIRKINETHAETQRALRAGTITTAEGLPTRRAAIDQLLGPDAGHQFSAAENVATKRLRSKYRNQSLHGVAPGDVAPQ